MTWHVSPEEWLLDFTSVPHGRVRGGESLDPIDDRLRKLLAPPPPKVGLIMPNLVAMILVSSSTLGMAFFRLSLAVKVI